MLALKTFLYYKQVPPAAYCFSQLKQGTYLIQLICDITMMSKALRTGSCYNPVL